MNNLITFDFGLFPQDNSRDPVCRVFSFFYPSPWSVRPRGDYLSLSSTWLFSITGVSTTTERYVLSG